MTLLDAYTIYKKLKQTEAAVKVAVVGEMVEGPVVKGLKIGGRIIDLPLSPIVRR